MKHLIIPDCQVKDGVSLDYLDWIGQYIVDKKPNVIVCIGDFADMPSLSSYDKGTKSFEGRRYKKDIEVTKAAMTRLLTPMREYNERARRNKDKTYRPRMVLTLGNHEQRITRAVESDPKLDGTISIDDLQYKQNGWEVFDFLKPVVVGHQQGRQIAFGKRADGADFTCIIAGSCYLHNEDYMGHQGNNHWRGILMLHEVKDGHFDEMMVSLDYLKKTYGTDQPTQCQ
jgi:hypothetical protein